MDFSKIEEKMDKTISVLQENFAEVRAGRANPAILNKVKVDYYGTPTPINQMAGISVPEARQLLIKPFDKSCLSAIEKAILASNLGYNPSNDGETVRIIIPELTEERRRELAKQVKAISEESKVSIRNIRHDALEDIKKAELPEDIEKAMEKDIQDLVNEYNKKVDEKLKEKENELLTV